MFTLLLLLACGSCTEQPAQSKKKSKSKATKSAVVDWPAVSAQVQANDEGIMAAGLANVQAAALSRPVPRRADGTPADDIAVIVLDTVRADHLGLYGYAEKTSPQLDAWSANARVWERAYADAPWTLPSHASMFTGKCQREHGARSLDESDPRKGAPLAQSEVTIAEHLQAAGYRTVGVAGNRAFLHPAYGLSQGFDTWINEQPEDDPRGVPYTAADRIVPMALAAAQQSDEHPLFLFVNLMDAHTPYKPRKGLVEHPEKLLRKSIPGNGGGFRKQATRLMQGSLLEPEVFQTWTLAYDAELRWLDQNLGTLLAGLASFEHVFILADHGEYLGEHNLVEHAKDVYEPVNHIPFLARSSRFPPGRDTSFIQTHDLAWMVLESAGLPVPASVHRTTDVAVTDLYYTLKKDLMNPDYGHRFKRIRRAFRVGDEKLIVGSDNTREGYDLANDPAEAKPKYASPVFEGLAEKYAAEHPEVPVVPLDQTPPEPTDEQLRALGYVE